jgi:hypothetical protein
VAAGICKSTAAPSWPQNGVLGAVEGPLDGLGRPDDFLLFFYGFATGAENTIIPRP